MTGLVCLFLLIVPMCFISVANGVDFFNFAPREFSQQRFATPSASASARQNNNSIPGPSFFSNFQMPFLSFEEIIVKDAESDSTESASQPQQQLVAQGKTDFPTDFFDQFEQFADHQPHFNLSDIERLESEMETTEEPNSLFSVFRITTDGKTPFGAEKESEILYDNDGQPSIVVVYADMTTSESMTSATYEKEDSSKKDDETSAAAPLVGGKGEDVDEYDDVDRSGGGHGGGGSAHGGGYDDGDDHGGGGYDDIHVHGKSSSDHHVSSGYDDHDQGYVPQKKPGPYGYGKPNYKCEYAKEQLYVTKTDYKFGKKCYKILNVQCKTKYDTGKDIGFKKVCNEFSVTKCRTVYATKFKTKCWLVYKKKCEDIYTTKVDWVYKEKCSTTYKKQCSGYGYHKQCHEVPNEICKQVPEKVEKQMKSVKCKKVPDKKCKILRRCHCKCNCNCNCQKDVPFFVPKKECKDFPTTICTEDPINIKKDVPVKVCFTVPIEKCVKIPREVLKHVPKTVKKKICVSTKPHDDHGGYSSSGGDDHGGGYDDGDDHGGYSSDQHFRSAPAAEVEKTEPQSNKAPAHGVQSAGFPAFGEFNVGNTFKFQ